MVNLLERTAPELVVRRYREPGYRDFVYRAVAHRNTVALIYDEALTSAPAPDAGAFLVRDYVHERNLVKDVEVADDTVTLTLGGYYLSGGSQILVRYRAADAGGNPIRDLAGNAAADFDLSWDEVDIKAPVPPPPKPPKVMEVLRNGGRSVTLTFDKRLAGEASLEDKDGYRYPGPEAFRFKVGDGVKVPRTPLSVYVEDRKYLTLDLGAPVAREQTVRVSYTAPDVNPLRGDRGDRQPPVADFEDKPALYRKTFRPGKPLLTTESNAQSVTVSAWVYNGGSQVIKMFAGLFEERATADYFAAHPLYLNDTYEHSRAMTIATRFQTTGFTFQRRNNNETYYALVAAGNDYNFDHQIDYRISDIAVAVTPTVGVGGMSVSGNSLSVELNREKDSGSRPPGSAFEVTATPADGGAPRTISGTGTGTAVVIGDTASVSLASTVADGERVTVRYTPPGTGPVLRDKDGGLPVPGFSGDSDAVGNGPLEVTGVAVVSDPGRAGAYAAGDTIRVEVAFGEAVEVTGAPRLKIGMGDGEKWADYESGSGTAALVFAYGPVAAADDAPLGIAVLADTLELNGAAGPRGSRPRPGAQGGPRPGAGH